MTLAARCLQPDAAPALAGRANRVWLPALLPFAPRFWRLAVNLPVLDVNGTLAAALAARRPFRVAAPVAGVFACDPFLRVRDLRAALGRAGIREVVNYPTVQLHDGESAATLAALGMRAEDEFRILLALAEGGLSPIACATSPGAAARALAMGLRRVLLHPGLAPRVDPAGWWADVAAHVAVEGGEALAWQDGTGVQAASSPRRRIRL